MPQVCPVTPNVTRAWPLPLGVCPTARFSHQPRGSQKYIVHIHEQSTPAHSLSPGLPGLLCTTSAAGYQRGTTLPAAGPPLCKHGPKKPHIIFFFSLQSRGLRHFQKRSEGAGREAGTIKFRGEYKLQMHNMNWTLSQSHFQTMRQQTTLPLFTYLGKFWKGTSPKWYDVSFPYICLALTHLPLHCQHLWPLGPKEKTSRKCLGKKLSGQVSQKIPGGWQHLCQEAAVHEK